MPLTNIINLVDSITQVAQPDRGRRTQLQLIQANNIKINAISCFENTKLVDINRARNDIVSIAKKIKIYDCYAEDIKRFCEKLENKNITNLDKKTAKYFYKDLGECFSAINNHDLSQRGADSAELTQALQKFFENLKANNRESLTQALLAYAIAKNYSLGKVSTKIHQARVKIIETVINKFVEVNNIYIGEEGKNEYIKAYQNSLKKCRWMFSDMFTFEPLPDHLEKVILPLSKELARILDSSTSFFSVIKVVGDEIYRNVQAFVASQNPPLSQNPLIISSNKVKLEIAAFLKNRDISVSLYSVLEKKGVGKVLQLQKNAVAIYGALIEELAKENNGNVYYSIETFRIAPLINIKAYKDFFWVGYGRGARGALTLETLIKNNVTKITNVKLLRIALKNSSSSYIKEIKNPIVCTQPGELFTDLLDEKEYLFFKLYLSCKLMNLDHIDENGNSFIHAIVYHNDIEAWVKYEIFAVNLINKINKEGLTALQLAVNKNLANMVLNLLDCREIDIAIVDSKNVTALDMAIEMNYLDIIAILKSHEISTHGTKRRYLHVGTPAAVSDEETGVATKRHKHA